MDKEEVRKIVIEELSKIYGKQQDKNFSFETKSKSRKMRTKLIHNDPEAKCLSCGTHENLTVDHIIPKSFLYSIEVEPFEYEDNLEVLCLICNKMKKDRIDIDNPKTIPLLKKIINNL